MHSDLKQSLEDIFRTSNSSDELFDAFRVAIDRKIKDEEFYKVLLRNSALSIDEISMFAGKICKEFPEISYSIFFCVGQLFSSISSYSKHHEEALRFYLKAVSKNPQAHEPYLAIAKMYNNELNVPSFEVLVQIIADGITFVNIKSVLCFALADLYKLKGDYEREQNYLTLGELYRQEGK
jgi:tetratricopeptide (TPR) repeat protein